MSLWTPSGEYPLRRGGEEGLSGGGEPADEAGAPPPAGTGGGEPQGDGEPELDELRRQLANTPAEVVVANHCYGLFELAAVYLSQAPPRLGPAQLAIDALGALLDATGPRLGEAQRGLQEGLTQLRLAFVQMSAAEQARAAAAGEGRQTNGAT